MVLEELRRLAGRMNDDPEPIRSFHTVYQFNISDREASFQVRFEGGNVTVMEGTPESSACALTMSESNFLKLLRGDLNAAMAFMLGNLKVDGKMGLALKLQEALQHYS